MKRRHSETGAATTGTRGKWNGTIRVVEDALTKPLTWKKPRRVFVNSMSDLFHENVEWEVIDRVFAVMALAPQHTFQILTKRPDRMLKYMVALDRDRRIHTDTHPRYLGVAEQLLTEQGDHTTMVTPDWPLPNVWLGVSVEDQATADARIPLLLQTPAAVRFISAEPLLGPVTLLRWMPHPAVYRIHAPSPSGKQQSQCVQCGRVTAGMERECRTFEMGQGLDWVIVGGESGPGARACDVAWVRSIVEQCAAANVSCFVKQLGANVRDRNDAGFMGEEADHWPEDIAFEDRVEHDLDGTRDGYQGAPVRIHLRDRKGGDMAEWPEDLRVRQFPEVRA